MARMNDNVESGWPTAEGKQPRCCERAGCTEAGEYRAPRSPGDLDSYYWFCLDHVREYNAQWDFFDGMNADEIDAFRRDDIIGHRPTWPMSAGRAFRSTWDKGRIRDFFGVFGDGDRNGRDAPGAAMPANERDALAVLDLDPAATRSDIKGRFKQLVKRHHPDVNGGDKSAEERLKHVIKAYRLLLRSRPA